MSLLYLNGSPIPSGYTITIYKYEPFSYTFTANPFTYGGLRLISASTLITSMVRQNAFEVNFRSPNYIPWDPQTVGYTGATSTTEQIVIGWGTSGAPVVVQQTFTINVVIKAGRFVIPTLTSPSYNLFVNESVASTLGGDIQFGAPGNLTVTTPFTSPALPPGLSFVPAGASPNLNWYLTGTPVAGIPPTAYTVYARGSSNTSFTISKTITLTVGSERVLLGVAPSSNISMTVGTPIPNTTITASYPNSFTSNLAYSWSFLPNGLEFVDVSSNTVTSPFRPGDSNSTMILRGTPTEAAAQFYRAAGVSNFITNILATRQTTPNLTATVPIGLSIGPTVLFDAISIPQLYVNSTIPSTSIAITANTYFPYSQGMASITAPSLPPGLSLVHTPGSSVAYLTGTPTATASNTYAITATNSNAISQTSNVTISVIADTIAFNTSDVCYNFVISRPLEQALTGYYPSNIVYTATVASGANVILSVTNLSNVGITTTSVGSSLSIGGVPDTITGPTTAVITAVAPTTGATNSVNLNYQILTDDISLTNPTNQLAFFQNQEITPVQFTATTLSGRPIVNWTSSNLPSNLSISSTGRLTGIPSGFTVIPTTFDVTASTGYVSETNSIFYNSTRDDVLLALVQDPTQVSAQFSNVEMRVITYSGTAGSFSVTQIAPDQPDPITLGTSGNYLTGDLSASAVLPEYRFRLTGTAGSFTDTFDFDIMVNNPDIQRRFAIDTSLTAPVTPPSIPFLKGIRRLYTNENSLLSFTSPGLGGNYATNTFSNSTLVFTTANADQGLFGAFGQSSNVCMLTSGSNMYRSTTNGSTWSLIPASDISTVPGIVGAYFSIPPIVTTAPVFTAIASDGGSNWVALANGYDSNNSYAQTTIVRTSSNDGVTWRDASLSSPILDGTALAPSFGTRLYYNNGRYFLANGLTIPPSTSWRADASNLTMWSSVLSNITAFAFSNNTVLATDGSTLQKSTDNGINWSAETWAGGSISNILYVGGNRWYINASDGIWSASNSTNFSNIDSNVVDGNTDFDGASVYNSNIIIPYDSNWDVASGPSIGGSVVGTRIIRSQNITASISASTNTSSFIEPTTTDYTFLQYAGANIPIQLTPSVGFVYYYATDLPQGMRLVLDTSGVAADISGIPTLYNSLPQRMFVFARKPFANTLTSLEISYRVISPFVLKPQSGAGGYTAFLRQYVEVNAAHGAVNAVALPNEENPIGKFTSPGVPDVVTTSNCEC